MYYKSVKTPIITAITIALVLPALGCGPNCQKIISTKKPEDLAYEDSVRINGLVERRKAAMDMAKGGNQYVIEDAKQTVTACEMAIEFQIQIVNLQKTGSPLIEENIKKINDARCFLDEVLESKGKLIGTGKGAFISGSYARQIHAYLEEFKARFGNEGALSERRLVDTFEKGVKIKKAKSADEKSEDGEEEEGVDESADDAALDHTGEEEADVGGDLLDEGEGGEDEEEGEEESDDSSMDSF